MRRGIIKILLVFALIWAIPLTVTFAQTDTQFRLCLPKNQGWVYKELPTVVNEETQLTSVTLEYKSSDSLSQDVLICIDRKGTGMFAFWDRATEIKLYRVGDAHTLTASRNEYIKNYKLRLCVRNAVNEKFTPFVEGIVVTF